MQLKWMRQASPYIVMLTLALTAVTALTLPMALARYATQGTVTAAARVAGFGVAISSGGDTPFANDDYYQLFKNMTASAVNVPERTATFVVTNIAANKFGVLKNAIKWFDSFKFSRS